MTALAEQAAGPAPHWDRDRLAALGFVAPAVAALILLFVLPLALLFAASLRDGDSFSLAAYAKLFGEAYYLRVIWNSLRLAVC